MANDERLSAGAPSFDGRVDLLLIPWRVAALALALAGARRPGPGDLRPTSPSPAWDRWASPPCGGGRRPGSSARRRSWLSSPRSVIRPDPVLREDPVQLLAPYVGARRPRDHRLVLGQGRALRPGRGASQRSGTSTRCASSSARRSARVACPRTTSWPGPRGDPRSGNAVRVAARPDSGEHGDQHRQPPAGDVDPGLPRHELPRSSEPRHRPARCGSRSRAPWPSSPASTSGERRSSPGPGEEPYVDVCSSLYHFGVTLCDLVRGPAGAVAAAACDGLHRAGRPDPVLLRERGDRRSRETIRCRSRRHRASAATLGFFLLGLYVFPYGVPDGLPGHAGPHGSTTTTTRPT